MCGTISSQVDAAMNIDVQRTPSVDPPSLRRRHSPLVVAAMDIDGQRTPSVDPPSLRRRLPTLPSLSDNSVAPWNRRQRQVSLGELSLQQSVKRRVEEDRQRQAARYTVSLESESEAETFAQLDGQFGDDDVMGTTYTVFSHEKDDTAKIKMLEKEIDELKLKRKRTDLSSKSSSSGSSTHRVPEPKMLRSSAKANIRGSAQKVPEKVKVSDRKSHHVTRRKVGVSGPGYSSDHSSDDATLGDDGKVRRSKKSSDGALGDMGETRRKKSVAEATLSSDDAKRKQKRHSRTTANVTKRHSRRRLVLSSSDKNSGKVKRHTRRKVLVLPSDEDKLEVEAQYAGETCCILVR